MSTSSAFLAPSPLPLRDVARNAVSPRVLVPVCAASGSRGAVKRRDKRVGSFRKLQERRRQGPQVNREQTARDKEHEKLRAELDERRAVEVKRIRSELKARRREREEAGTLTQLRDMEIGMQLRGVVNNLVRHGAYVDVGAPRDGLVHVRDMSVGFVHNVENIVQPGDEVDVWVKYVNAASNTLALSMRRPVKEVPARIPIGEVQVGGRYQGVVARITDFGAYVDIGAEQLAFLHINAMWGRRPRDTLDELTLGRSIWADVMDVDEVRSFVRLNARGRGGFQRLDALGKVPAEPVLSPSTHVPRSVVLERPGRTRSDEDDIMPQGAAGRAMMIAKEKARDDLLMENVGPSSQTEEWDNVRQMFDETTEFVGMDSEEDGDDVE